MDRLLCMRVFQAVAEQHSFSQAARILNLSASAVTRAVTQLESQLDLQLLKRSTRQVQLTELGQDYLEDIKPIIAAIDEADAKAMGKKAQPKGCLKITAPVLFGRLKVLPVVQEYLQRYPDIEVQSLLLDRVVNLVEEGLDLGIRIGELQDSNLRAIKVGYVRVLSVASPEYLKLFGQPQHPQELKQHRLIHSTTGNRTMEWRFNIEGKSKTFTLQPRLVVNDNQAAVDAAIRAFGITRVLSYQVKQPLAEQTLVRVLADFELPALPVHIVHTEGRQATTKTRLFINLLTERLRGEAL